MIRRYRSRPIEIEAEQYLGDREGRGVCFCRGQKPHLHTMHKDQQVVLEAGDYIIPEPDGVHFYPCKPDVFEKKYEELQ